MQAYENPTLILPFEAAVDLVRGQLVNVDSAEKAALCTAGVKITGVVHEDASAGDSVPVVVSGVAVVKAGAAVVAGAIIASDSTARAITALTAKYPGGTALQAASAANVFISVLINPGQVVLA